MTLSLFQRLSSTSVAGLIKSTFFRLCVASIGMHFCVMANAAVEPLTVNGSQIQVGGQPKALAGNSFFWSNTGWGQEKYYNSDTVKWLKSDWNANIVRAAMGVDEGGGYLQDRAGNKARVKTIVDTAIAEDMYVIIDWHSHHAEDYRAEAVEFFTEMAQTYGQYDNVIYEIYNEPLQVSWSNTIKPYAEAVISAIRAVDPDNLIIVGTPTWSQDVDQAAADPISGFDNIAYTLHFYAGTHKQWLRDRAEQAMNSGIAIMVTEWGTVNANGDGAVDTAETQAWVDWMQQYNITHLNWSVSDKAEGASIVQPGASPSGNWSNSSLTASGQLVRSIIREQNSGSDDGGGDDNGGGDNGGSDSPCQNAAAVNLPGTVEAEEFCDHDGIRTQATSDSGGGENIGWIDSGDWSEYRVNVAQAGTFELEARVASANAGGTIEILVDGSMVGSVAVSGTGGWQAWETEIIDIDLAAGEQTIRLNFVGNRSGLLNVNWVRLSAASDGGGDNGGGDNGGGDNGGGDNGGGDNGGGDSDVSCEFLVINEWQSGFVGEIKITNGGNAPISNDWSVAFQFTDGTSFLNGWNGTFSGTEPITVSPLSWNRTIAPNSSVTFGLQANKGTPGMSVSAPVVTGSICD